MTNEEIQKIKKEIASLNKVHQTISDMLNEKNATADKESFTALSSARVSVTSAISYLKQIDMRTTREKEDDESMFGQFKSN